MGNKIDTVQWIVSLIIIVGLAWALIQQFGLNQERRRDANLAEVCVKAKGEPRFAIGEYIEYVGCK